MGLLDAIRKRDAEAATLEELFEKSGMEAWNRLCDYARAHAGQVDDASLDVAAREMRRSPSSFLCLLLIPAARLPERRGTYVAMLRGRLPAHPAEALSTAGYNLHEFHYVLD